VRWKPRAFLKPLGPRTAGKLAQNEEKEGGNERARDWLLPGPDGTENRLQNLPKSAGENLGGKHLQSSNRQKFK